MHQGVVLLVKRFVLILNFVELFVELPDSFGELLLRNSEILVSLDQFVVDFLLFLNPEVHVFNLDPQHVVLLFQVVTFLQFFLQILLNLFRLSLFDS